MKNKIIKNINFVMIMNFVLIFLIITSNQYTVIEKFLFCIVIVGLYICGYMIATCLAGLVMFGSESESTRDDFPPIIPKLGNINELFESYNEYPDAVNIHFYYKRDGSMFMGIKNVMGELIYIKEQYDENNFVQDYNKWIIERRVN